MTIDDWFQKRGVNPYAYLGNPVDILHKDEADETLKFLRSASDKDVGAWLGQIQKRVIDGKDKNARLTKEQVLALGDRPGFNMPGWISGEAPAIMPDELGEIIADKYKGAEEGQKDHWRQAAQDYATYIGTSQRFKKFREDIGNDPSMQAAVMTAAPHQFSDVEKKSLLHHAIDTGDGDILRQIRSGLADDLLKRPDAPDWAPDFMAVNAAMGFPIDKWKDPSTVEVAANKFTDTYRKLKQKQSPETHLDILSNVADAFDGHIERYLATSKAAPYEFLRAGRILPKGKAKEAWLSALESKADESRKAYLRMDKEGGSVPDSFMSNEMERDFRKEIIGRSEDNEQIKRVVESSPDPLQSAAHLMANPNHPTNIRPNIKAMDIAKGVVSKYLKEDEKPDINAAHNLRYIGRQFAVADHHEDLKELYDQASGSRKRLAAESFAVPSLIGLSKEDADYAQRRESANTFWRDAFRDYPKHIRDPYSEFDGLRGETVAHLDPDVFTHAVNVVGLDDTNLLDELPDEHLKSLNEHRGIQDRFPQLSTHIKAEASKRAPADPITFTPGSNRLRLLREHLSKQPDTRAHKKGLEQDGFNVQNMGLSSLLDAKGNLTHESLDRHINSLPTRTVGHKLMSWGDEDAHHMSVSQQRHSPELSKVFSVSLSPEDAESMKQAGTFKHLEHNANQSSSGGHPTIPKTGIGWVRYTEGKDGIHIDEVQSDFGSNLRAKAQKTYKPDELQEFEKAYQQVWQGKRPNEVLHDAFLEHMRQEGNVGKPVHMWTVKPKMQLAGQRTTETPPAHMQETYTAMPAKAGYQPDTYGKIETQSGPLQGQPTWSHKLAKFEQQLDGWYASRLEKGWRNQLLGAVAASGMALSNTAHAPEIPKAPESQGALVDANVGGATGINQQTLAKPVQKPVAKWTPEGLPDELHPVAHLESSFGRNVNHAKNPAGEFQTAYGALGFKPMTAWDEIKNRPSLRAMYPNVDSPEKLMEEMKSNPRFYNQVAGAHFARLKSVMGGDAGKAAYGWRWGATAAQTSSPEQIEADPYVQKYRAMTEQRQQAKMNQVMDGLLRKHVLPTAMVRIEDGELQVDAGGEWITVASASDNNWTFPVVQDRIAKAIQRDLINGE